MFNKVSCFNILSSFRRGGVSRFFLEFIEFVDVCKVLFYVIIVSSKGKG